MKTKLKKWFLEENRLDELEDDLAAKAFGEVSLDEFKALKSEIVVELTIENLGEMPNLSFHAQKALFPYPSSKQLQEAREKLGLGPAKMSHKSGRILGL